jgi:hypothetical protein
MKSNSHPSLKYSQRSKDQQATADSTNQSPYLKAVLAEKKTTARVMSIETNSSLAAALRYITQSRQLA